MRLTKGKRIKILKSQIKYLQKHNETLESINSCVIAKISCFFERQILIYQIACTILCVLILTVALWR